MEKDIKLMDQDSKSIKPDGFLKEWNGILKDEDAILTDWESKTKPDAFLTDFEEISIKTICIYFFGWCLQSYFSVSPLQNRPKRPLTLRERSNRRLEKNDAESIKGL